MAEEADVGDSALGGCRGRVCEVELFGAQKDKALAQADRRCYERYPAQYRGGGVLLGCSREEDGVADEGRHPRVGGAPVELDWGSALGYAAVAQHGDGVGRGQGGRCRGR
ncbi:hypothetical protein [Streptomyces sp. NPDC056543]|uniref:hypothetical protein n=1 Tax=unclassified Streptomyces TaxID=2593676 RepID=UPI0036B9E8C0